MLARPLYRFARFDLKQIPRAKRRQALKLQLDQWSPFVASGYYIAWQEGVASVWCWDAGRVQRAMGETRINPKRVGIIPETLLYPAGNNGLRLLKCLDGYEAQLWRNGQLEQSRWWPQLPGAGEWMTFQRDAGSQPQEQMAAIAQATALPMLPSPWAKSTGLLGQPDQAWQYERLAVALGVVLLALPSLWYGLSLFKLHQAQAMRASQLARIQRQAQPIIEARRQALDGMARIRALRNLDPYPDQLALMATVAETLPRNDAFLKEWNYQDGRLKITIAAPAALSSSSLVSAFQLAGPFSDVKALASAPGTAALQMQISGS